MHEVTTGQLVLLFVSIALLVIGLGLSLARNWRDGDGVRITAKVAQCLGAAAGLGVLLWHAIGRKSWLPLEDNFDALVWLGLLLALFVLYMQRVHPLRGLDWFVLPIAILLLASAAIFGKAKPHEYNVASIWVWVHRVAAYGGAVALAVSAAVGAMYLNVSRRLRAKRPMPGPNMGSLERLEHLVLTSVTLGFSLLTIGAVTGIVRWFAADKTPPAAKVILTAIAWVVYAIVLHSPINPSFRGRKAAILSVVGFVLIVGVLVAVQFMPGRG